MVPRPTRGRTFGQMFFYYLFAVLFGAGVGLYIGWDWQFSSRNAVGLALSLGTAFFIVAALAEDDFGVLVAWCVDWVFDDE